MDTQNFYDLRIEDADDGTVITESGGTVSTNGESAVVYVWDEERGKPQQIDRLTGATVKRTNQSMTLLTGTSQDLVRQVGVQKEHAQRNLKLYHGYPLDISKVKV